MNCSEIKKLIPIYLDNSSLSQENQWIKEHVIGCPSCQQELVAYQKTWAL